jgi:farnesyl-diphosphate farnesyltransferase
MNCGKLKAKKSPFFSGHFDAKSLANQAKTAQKVSPKCRNFRGDPGRVLLRQKSLSSGLFPVRIAALYESMTELTASQNALLRATSRSFYLTLRMLPRAIRTQIALAYLLARTSDTIADTEIVPIDQRLAALQKLRERFLGKIRTPLDFNELAGKQGTSAEKLLLEKANDSLDALQALSATDQKNIRDVLATITGGQELDLRRFTPSEKAASEAPRIIALETAVELDDYTYRVAGCVGEFWTKMCRVHIFPDAKLDEYRFIMSGIRFGKGLQLINILRDLPADLKKGRCYLPTEKMDKYKLSPRTMLSTANESRFMPLFREYLDKAEEHLRAGWDYTNMLPFSQFRLRLACAWPILIGMETIEQLRGAGVIELQQGVKVPRSEVRHIILRSVLACPVPGVWKNLFPVKAVALDGKLA